jgi:hypothetical protein
VAAQQHRFGFITYVLCLDVATHRRNGGVEVRGGTEVFNDLTSLRYRTPPENPWKTRSRQRSAITTAFAGIPRKAVQPGRTRLVRQDPHLHHAQTPRHGRIPSPGTRT